MKEIAPVPLAASPKPRISYAIARLQQLVLASVTNHVAPAGLTALQFTTLSVLSRHGAPLSNSQLARRSFMTPQSMHEVIHRLEADGLITRDPHPQHRRRLPASLTAKGRRVLASCDSEIASFEEGMLRGFSRAERTTFLEMITSAVRNLGGGFGEMEKPLSPNGLPRGTSAAGHATGAERSAPARARKPTRRAGTGA